MKMKKSMRQMSVEFQVSMIVHVNFTNKSSASTKSKSTPAKTTAASSNKSTASSRSENVTEATTTSRGISEA